MARFHFHLCTEGVLVCDELGEEFASAESAIDFGLTVGGELARNAALERLVNDVLLVVDENGAVILGIPLASVEASCGVAQQQSPLRGHSRQSSHTHARVPLDFSRKLPSATERRRPVVRDS